jgi:phosphatidylinositol alpha-1,6-mannosyltransferase
MRTIAFVTPDLFGPIGGIARISRAMAMAIGHWSEKRGVRLQVHVLHDRDAVIDQRYLVGDASIQAFGGDRMGLMRAVATAGWRRQHLATVFGHLHLAVAGLLQPPHVRQALVAHGIEIWDPLPPHRLDRRLALWRQNAVWAISRHTAERVRVAHGLPHDRVRVVPNALDPFWVYSTEPAKPASPARILATSSLARGFEYKGIDATLRALARIPADVRPGFDIVGEGDDRPRLEALAQSLGLATSVVFHGRVDDATLSALYKGATAFVLPSTREGFGLVFIEAMAAGLPIITVDAGAAPEVVRDGETGLVVPPADLDALARAIMRLTSDPALAKRLGDRGFTSARKDHGFDRYRVAVAHALDALVDS